MITSSSSTSQILKKKKIVWTLSSYNVIPVSATVKLPNKLPEFQIKIKSHVILLRKSPEAKYFL